MDIEDADAAYALIAGMSKREQELLLRAILRDLGDERVEVVLRDEGLLDD